MNIKEISISQNVFDRKNYMSMLGKRKGFLTRKEQEEKKEDGLNSGSNYFLTGNLFLKT